MKTQIAKIWLSCIELAVSDFYGSHPNFKTRLILNIRDSNEDVVTAASQASDLIKNVQVQAILGPQSSTQAKFIIDLGQKAQVPIISFSATSPSLKMSSQQSSYFFQTATGDSSQVMAISSIVKAFGWRKIVPIYTANEYGEGIIPYLGDALRTVNAEIPYRSVISPFATDDQIKVELYKLETMQTRVFIVHMWYDLGSRLFTIAKKIGMLGQGYVWIITQDFTNLLNSLNSMELNSMEGVLGIMSFVPQTKELNSIKARWRNKFYKDTINDPSFHAKLNIMGMWAYDSVYALALAIERISNTTTLNSNVTIGPKLLEAISSTKFKGIAGNFILDNNGQLETSTFKIVNIVNGGGGREIGFWTRKDGLIRKLLLESNNDKYSTSKSNLGLIIWPGESILPPKGWEIPTNGKRLKIGIPVKSGFNEFVKVMNFDSSTNKSDATGFTIDVFKAALNVLPYALPYDFFPFVKPDVVADITIRANRSQYVDFTLPYTDSGVVMVVPMKDHKRKSPWIFLKPLTWDLWVTTFGFFLFTGFVVWVLEHQINEEFRGPPSHQIGTSFPDSQIVAYDSIEHCDQLLSMENAKGGIAAVVDETPYMKAFPKGSPLVGDISTAILNVTERDDMKNIENKWFESMDKSCLDSNPKISSNRLSLGSFWGLFIIAGVSSLFALIIFIVMFLHKNKQVLLDSNDSIEKRIKIGKIWLSCIELGLSDFYGSHPNFKSRLILNIRDSKEDVVTAASQGQKAQVPIISFSATSPSLKTSSQQSSYFFQTATSDSSQIMAISSIVKAFGWRKVVPIYTDNEYGEGILPYLSDALGAVNAEIPYRSVISPFATDDQIKVELYKLETMQTRVFIVHMWYDLGSRLFTIAKKIGMLEQDYVWIITQDFTNLLSSLNSMELNSMEGVLGIMSFVPQTKELNSIKTRWRTKFYKDTNNDPSFLDAKLNIMGMWAYDSVYALALAIEKIRESILPPKGWEIPTNGKRLRIGIPIKSGFNEFVKVMNFDSSTNKSDAIGFTIDVFKAALNVLPYALPYDFFPFVKPDGTSAGTYDDLVYQSGERVGYLRESFVYGLLRQTGFPDSQIVAYDSIEHCDQLLSIKNAKGGIAAVVDETPNMKVFLAQYCSKYTMIGPIFKTTGFGFAFPKGSPLVGDISTAILNVTERDDMKNIENKWFKPADKSCLDSNPKISPNRLSLGSFWGLFIIAGVSSLFALIIFVVMFLHKNKQVLLDSNDPFEKRIKVFLKKFDQKDLNFHHFRKSNNNNNNINNNNQLNGCGGMDMVELSNNNTECPPSPSDSNSLPVSMGEQRSTIVPTIDELLVQINEDH
ncbi:hypothetical protein F8388_014320 [Cannabis sativa]|uniref:Ionotropic glutamate receptor C-terminal domain-containing protein n=1 Tax=Cannabis sativa TaxID=3483 RepID=A0A7J6ELE3_CANSA|nr:hypothetical protein F8388_014320 [Cannabis sativa]